MSSTNVYRVKGNCSIGGKSYGLNSLSANISINSWPVYDVEVLLEADSSGKAKRIDEQVFNLLKGWLSKILSDGLNGHVDVTIDKYKININGYVSSIELTVHYSDLTVKATILPEFVKLDAFNLSPYLKTLMYATNKEYAIMYGKPTIEGKTLMLYVEAVYKFLKQRWSEKKDKFYTEQLTSQELLAMDTIMATNDSVELYFLELLHNSDKQLGDIYSISKMAYASGLVDASDVLFTLIVNCLCASSGTFISNICSLANMFRLVYVPESDKIGKFIPKSNMLDDENVKQGNKAVVSAAARSCQTNLFPLSMVYTITDYNSLDIEHNVGSNSKNRGNNVAYYQNVKGPSKVLSIAPPSWIPRNATIRPVNAEGKSPLKKKIRRPSLRGKHKKLDKKNEKSYAEMITDILYEWCRQEYVDQAMGNSTTTLTTFFSDFLCGVRRLEYFGSGFVGGCDTMVTINGNGIGSASTTYVFTHVKFL